MVAFRASRSAEPATPSKTPVSITQSLSSLRLSHAKLMEDFGSAQALLQHREQELQQLQERDAVAQETVKKLTSQVRELKSRATRSENEVTLHKREIGFLEALVVSVFVHYKLMIWLL